MLWIDVYYSMFQFPPISSNFAQPLKRSATTRHRKKRTKNKKHLSNSMRRRCVALHEANGGSHQILTGFLNPGPTFKVSVTKGLISVFPVM
jgi:hypothetical protein